MNNPDVPTRILDIVWNSYDCKVVLCLNFQMSQSKAYTLAKRDWPRREWPLPIKLQLGICWDMLGYDQFLCFMKCSGAGVCIALSDISPMAQDYGTCSVCRFTLADTQIRRYAM